ncbi:MAG: D-alanyl-D-alanine carboxypeptidase/D-alanyl-D-alanine-endopeptidase [Chlamydiales bacterium]
MRKITLIVAILGLLWSPSVYPSVAATPQEELRFLKNAIDRTIEQVNPDLHIGIEIVSLKNGLKIYEKNAKQMFIPASVQKLFTAAASLSILGSDFRFETALYSEGEIQNGILAGNLYLKGSGDPSLVTDDLETLVSELEGAGIKQIRGDLCIDHFDFDQVTLGPGWMWDEGAEFWNSPLDALLVNHSCVTLWIGPGENVGNPCQITMTPEIPSVEVCNYSKTSKEKGVLEVCRTSSTKGSRIQVSGTMDVKDLLREYRIPLEDPSLYAAELLHLLLGKHNIFVTGKIRYQKVPKGAKCIASHLSSPLSELVLYMTKTSDNLYANCFFKKIGEATCGAPGSWKKGTHALMQFLSEKVKMDTSRLVIVDGDGQSRYNLIAPDQLVTLLKWAKTQSLFYPEFLASLPLACVDGTLKERMCNAQVRGRVRAKTGTMTGVSTLAGYAATKEGEFLAFAIMTNGLTTTGRKYKEELEDEICTLLTSFSRDLR